MTTLTRKDVFFAIEQERARSILIRLANKGFAANNVVFGIGSYTYQYLTRDTFGFAMKATSGVVNGERRDIRKKPKTDGGIKNSACGLLRVEYIDGDFVLFDQQTEDQEACGALRDVWRDGKLLVDESLATIRARLRSSE